MSAIIWKVCNNKVTVSSDSISLLGEKISQNSKLFKINKDIIFGGTGYIDITQYLIYYISHKELPTNADNIIELRKYFLDAIKDYYNSSTIIDDNKNIFTTLNSSFILIYKNKIYILHSSNDNFIVLEDVTHVPYGGIGYYDMAMGAMIAGKSPEEALTIIDKYNAYISAPFLTYTHELI